MSRKTARIAAVQMVFESLFAGDGGDDTLLGLIGFQQEEDDLAFVERLCKGVEEHAQELDAMISAHLKNWTLDRISRVAHAAMRVAVYELKYEQDVPAGAVIKEAVQITQRFDEEGEGRFVNGVLSGILKELRPEAAE